MSIAAEGKVLTKGHSRGHSTRKPGRPRKPIPLEAIFRVEQGEKLRQVAREFEIAKSSLLDAVINHRQGHGFFLSAPPANFRTGHAPDLETPTDPPHRSKSTLKNSLQ